jgi:hypothetical protein
MEVTHYCDQGLRRHVLVSTNPPLYISLCTCNNKQNNKKTVVMIMMTMTMMMIISNYYTLTEYFPFLNCRKF